VNSPSNLIERSLVFTLKNAKKWHIAIGSVGQSFSSVDIAGEEVHSKVVQ
jgi:hypothetical protein